MMDPDIKAKWVDALRSGKYQQVRNNLCVSNSYCCLGVGVKVLRPSFPFGVLFTPSAITELGLTRTEGDTLVDLNDNKRMSFAEIADYIEANL